MAEAKIYSGMSVEEIKQLTAKRRDLRGDRGARNLDAASEATVRSGMTIEELKALTRLRLEETDQEQRAAREAGDLFPAVSHRGYAHAERRGADQHLPTYKHGTDSYYSAPVNILREDAGHGLRVDTSAGLQHAGFFPVQDPSQMFSQPSPASATSIPQASFLAGSPGSSVGLARDRSGSPPSQGVDMLNTRVYPPGYTPPAAWVHARARVSEVGLSRPQPLLHVPHRPVAEASRRSMSSPQPGAASAPNRVYRPAEDASRIREVDVRRDYGSTTQRQGCSMEGCRAPSNHPRTVPHLAHLTPGSLPHPALGNITEHVTMFDPGSLQESYSTSDSVLSSADSSSLPSIENRASSASSRGSSRLTGLPWDFQADWIDEEYSPNEARNARADGQVEDLAFSVAEKVLPGLKLSEDVRFPDLHQGYPLLDYHGLA